MSPKKKKPKLDVSEVTTNKRESTLQDSPRKRLKVVISEEDEMKARKRKNFIKACELVSYRDYFDHRARLLLVYLPSCMKLLCKHHNTNSGNVKQMPSYADESFRTEMKNNMWYDALEVCQMCITPTQYLSTDVLKDVVEIMLNAHEDETSEYSVKHIIDKSQQILMQNFSTHPPCLVKNLRNCYYKFLTSPMQLRENTFTNRTQFECNKGIIKYCMNRLEYELSFDSEDGPLVDREEKLPDDMRFSVKGMHWQKEKFEIYELLNRQERMGRLFTVLETIVELLQFDLAIWHSRYTNDLARHIMRSHKPLMAYVLWSENVLYTGAVTNNCRQILRIFAHMVHLGYPDSIVKIMAIWLNTMVQTFYICEQNSNMDYPNTSKYCSVFAKDFYAIMAGLPNHSIIRIIEKIQPTFMRHLIGILHIHRILSTNESCILKIVMSFVSERQWKLYSPDESDIELSNQLFTIRKRVKNKIGYLIKKSKSLPPIENEDEKKFMKMEPKIEKCKNRVELKHVVHSLYVTLDAYLDAYDVHSVQETWNTFNEKMSNEESEDILSIHNNYSVSESLIKKYRYISKSIKELEDLFSDLKNRGKLPNTLNVFANIKSIYF